MGGLLPLSSAGQHGAVRRVAEEQELGDNDGVARLSSFPRPRPPRQRVRQRARHFGPWASGKVPGVPSGAQVQEEKRGRAQLQTERRGSGRVSENMTLPFTPSLTTSVRTATTSTKR